MQGSTREVIDDAQFKRMVKDHRGTFFTRNDYKDRHVGAHRRQRGRLSRWRCGVRGIGFDISTRVLIDMGAMLPAAITSPADFYRFVTPMFLHLDVMHLLMNMMALYSVGALLEQVLGRANFVLLYFIAGITETWSRMRPTWCSARGMTVSAGASTSVFGLFVAVALLGVLCRGDRHFIREYSRA